MIEGVSRELATDKKHFTTAVYGNGPGYQIKNGIRPDVNATVAGKCFVSETLRCAAVAPSCGSTDMSFRLPFMPHQLYIDSRPSTIVMYHYSVFYIIIIIIIIIIINKQLFWTLVLAFGYT